MSNFSRLKEHVPQVFFQKESTVEIVLRLYRADGGWQRGASADVIFAEHGRVKPLPTKRPLQSRLGDENQISRRTALLRSRDGELGRDALAQDLRSGAREENLDRAVYACQTLQFL